MKLSQALHLKPHDIVAFVGAGGKTSAMFRLADELVQEGWRVLTTTTTHISQDEMHRAPYQIGLGPGMRLPAALHQQIQQFGHIFVFTKLEKNNRVKGVRPNWADEYLTSAPYIDVLLIEADGSRRLPMKAPLSHEPAIPDRATVVIPVVGIDVLGKSMNDDSIYGAEMIHKLIGYPTGKRIIPQLIAAALVHPRLSLKNIPPGARIIPLINKVTPRNLKSARQIAGYVLTDINIEQVLIGSVQEADPISEARRRVGAVILAAGQSKRMGRPKLLLDWNGSTIIRQVCKQIAACSPHETVIVAGQHEAEIRQQVKDLPVRVIFNPKYEEGEMLSSLKLGLLAIRQSCDAALVVLGDQPAIEQPVITGVLEAYYRQLAPIIAPSYRYRRGHPILIDRRFWEQIHALPSDAAPRDVIRANEAAIYHLEVDTPSVLADIDTPDDYRAALSGE